MRYIRQAIQYDGRHLQDIFALPCVESIHKQKGNNTSYAAVYNVVDNRTEYAFVGWWIVQLEYGPADYWVTMSNDVYQDTIKAQAAMDRTSIRSVRDEVETAAWRNT
jgi:hypothetical protein